MKNIILIMTFLFSLNSVLAQWDNSAEREQWNRQVEKKWDRRPEDVVGGRFYINSLITQDSYINPLKDNLAEGRYGTRVYFKYYSFDLPESFKPGEFIQLRITEILNPLDFYLSELDLTAPGEVVFESGGMLRVDAFYRNKPVAITGLGVEVQFPVVNPYLGHNFYSYENSQWVKKQDGKNIKTTSERSNSDNFEGEMGLLYKAVSGIKGFTWYNFDKPREDIICLSGHVSPPNSKYVVTVIGISKLGATSRSFTTGSFKINFLQNSVAKVIVDAEKDFLGASGEIQTSRKYSYYYSEEKKRGECQNIGEIKIAKVNPDLKKDRSQLLQYLGLRDWR